MLLAGDQEIRIGIVVVKVDHREAILPGQFAQFVVIKLAGVSRNASSPMVGRIDWHAENEGMRIQIRESPEK